MPRHRLLLVAYHFPPIAGSGVQRALKLATYLPENGIDVHVLTSGHTHYPLIDASLVGEIPARVSVHRIRGFDPGGLASRLTPNPESGLLHDALSAVEERLYWRLQSAADRWAMPEPEHWWIGSAVRAARRLHARYGFDAIVTTSPPHSGQRVGLELQRELGIPWIADLRDPIVDNFAYDPKDATTDACWKSLERDIVECADQIVVTCPDYSDVLASKYAIGNSRIACITNGYDESDRPASPGSPSRDMFELSHIGAFYRAQSIEPLLDACRGFRQRRQDAKMELRLVGSVSRQQALFLQDADDAFVQRIGYKSHADALIEMARSDALFLMTPTNANGRHCIPAKLFEYLAFGRQIVALVHRDSSVDQILREAGSNHIAYHDDSGALVRCLERAHDDWRSGATAPNRHSHVIHTYRRDRLAAKYAELIASRITEKAAPVAAGGVGQ